MYLCFINRAIENGITEKIDSFSFLYVLAVCVSECFFLRLFKSIELNALNLNTTISLRRLITCFDKKKRIGKKYDGN